VIAGLIAVLLTMLWPFAAQRSITAQSTVTGAICALAFTDSNANGIHDANETALSNVNISLLINGKIVVANHLSDTQGQYCFENLLPGQYTLTFNSPLVDATTLNTFAIGLNAGDRPTREFGGTVRTQFGGAGLRLTQTGRIALSLLGAVLAMALTASIGIIARSLQVLRRR